MQQGFGLRPVHTLSGGQRQRVAIAGALAEKPQVRGSLRPHIASSTQLTFACRRCCFWTS
jgi:ABC-type arginine transport system ATPase subunit